MSEVVLKLRYDGEYWVAEISAFGAAGVGTTLKDALSRLGESIEVAIETYAHEKDENLTRDALILKKRLLALLEVPENERHNNSL